MLNIKITQKPPIPWMKLVEASDDFSLVITKVGRYLYEPESWGGNVIWRHTPTLEFLLIWSGHGRMELRQGESAHIHPGTSFWLRPGSRFIYWPDSTEPLGITYIGFTLTFQGEPIPTSALPPEMICWRDFEQVDAISTRIVNLQLDGTYGEMIAGHAYLRALLYDYTAFAEHERAVIISDVKGEKLPYNKQTHEMQRLVRRIEEAPGLPWSTAELAQEFSYSEGHFRSVFRRETGMSFQDLVIHKRVLRAKFLLTETELSVSEIAQSLSYNDVYYFSRQFKKVAGMPPKAWRSSHPHEQAPPANDQAQSD